MAYCRDSFFILKFSSEGMVRLPLPGEGWGVNNSLRHKVEIMHERLETKDQKGIVPCSLTKHKF